MAGCSTGGKRESANENGNGLLLYQYYSCYYSQKVYMALHEKNLKFKCHAVDLFKGEHFQPWFIKINPKAEVPVLKDGVKIIPDSDRIIDYLEDNFSNGDTPRLRPEKGSDQYQKMQQILSQLDQIPVGLIIYGCYSYPELTNDMQTKPYDVKRALGKYTVHMEILSDYAEQYVEFKSVYEERKRCLQSRWDEVQNIDEVRKALDGLDVILDEIEKELSSHTDDDWWLCAKKFTIADIGVAVLLNRLHEIGLWKRYFGSAKRPYTDAYFKRLQHRESFKKTISQNSGLLKTFCCGGAKVKILFAVGSFAVILGLVGVGVYIYQRKK